MNAPTLRFFGSKWRQGPSITQLFPDHKNYVELYGGSMAVLLQKQRSMKEVYIDLDDEVVNFFIVARTCTDKLIELLTFTTYSKAEYELATIPSQDPLERARRFFVRSWMGVGGEGIKHKSGFRKSYKFNIQPERNFSRSTRLLNDLAEMIAAVQIERAKALDALQKYDSAKTLFYVDPPYPKETRTGSGRYRIEMTTDDHVELLENLQSEQGKVVLSSYESDLYNKYLSNWEKHSMNTNTSGQVQRTEIVWTNFTTQKLQP